MADMRRLLMAALLALSFAAPVRAASLSADQLTAIDKAAEVFLAKAADAKKTGMVPRQSDPAVAALLDTVFDTSALSHGAILYTDYAKLDDWDTRIVKVGQVYVEAAARLHDLGIFGTEIGRYLDADVAVMQTMAETLQTELDSHRGETLPAPLLKQQNEMRATITKSLTQIIGNGLRAPGITIGWVEQRVAVLTTAAPSFGRFLPPADIERLRQTTLGLAQRLREKSVRALLGGLAVAFATPRAPIAASPEVAPASNEIVLESEGRGYRVTGRINGTTEVRFVVDSGATYVALPQDIVDDMIKAGTIADTDMRGSAVFVIANGKRHRATQLMLRQLDVGGHVVTNVMASVLPAHAHALLGMSFLGKFKSWTLDNERHVLIVEE